MRDLDIAQQQQHLERRQSDRSSAGNVVASVTLEYCGVVKYDVLLLLRLMMPFCRHHTPATETRTVTED